MSLAARAIAGELDQFDESRLERAADDFGHRLMEARPALQARARFLERTGGAADDLVQDTLERALRKSNQFRPGTDMRRWLMVIMQNLFADRWRERVRFRYGTKDLAELPEPKEPEDGLPSRSEVASVDDIRALLASINEPLRLAFELCYFEHLTYQDIARRLGVPVTTVGTRILRVRSRLCHAIDERRRRDN